MTTEEKVAWLKSLPKTMISPKELAMVTDGDPYSYNIAAKQGKLNLPHEWHGRNLRIWKEPVIKLIGG
jgi:DNA topoisomerase VI subunit A